MVTTTVMYRFTTQENGGDVMMIEFSNSEGIQMMSTMNYHIKMYKRGLNIYYERII